MTDDELIEKYISKDEWTHPKDGYLTDYGTPVWALVNALRLYDGDVNEVASGYQIPLEAMEAALAYYRRYTAVIDAFLVLNDPALV